MDYQIINYIERPGRRRHSSLLGIALTVFILIIILGQPKPASAQTQWTTATNGTDIYKTSGGNVGIGTTTPVSQLEIVGAAPYITLTHGNGTWDNSEIVYRSSSGFYKWGIINYSDASGNTALQNSLTFFQFTDKNNATLNTPRMVIDNAGSVGIGTTAPAGILDVQQSNAGRMLARFINTNTSGSTSVRASTSSVSSSTVYPAYEFGDAAYWLASLAADRTNGLRFRTGLTSSGEAALTDRMTILPTGNVGIGTLTPGYKLDVAGTINATAIYQNGSPFSGSQWTTGGSNISYSSGNVGIGTATPGYKLDVAGTINASAIYQNGAPFSTTQWATNGANISYNSGNVGIGTATPGYKLDVGGTLNATTIYQNGSPFSSSQWTTSGANISYSSGNIGVGTTTPDSRLHIQGAAQLPTFTGNSRGVLTISAPYTNLYYTALDFNYADGVYPSARIAMQFTGAAGSSLLFGTSNNSNNGITNTAMLINSGGNVGIGTLTPGYKLDVAGTINATAIYQNGVPFSGGGSSQWTTSGANISYSTGNVGIGTTTPAYKLDVGGTLNATAIYQNGSLFSSSQWTTTANNISYSAGNVGIGGSAASDKKLKVTGNVMVVGDMEVTGVIYANYQDVAEWVASTQAIPAATVVVLDPTKSNQVLASTQAYDTRVAGVISVKPGIALGERSEGKVLVATTGRVKVKVDATRAPIHVGDLLVTSEKEGVAMRSEPLDLGGVPIHRPGTLIGKALEPLEKGTGEILVLLSLQ